MNKGTITVFGGTGFLGRRVVESLLELGCHVRVAARHPERINSSDVRVEPMATDVCYEEEVARAVDGASGVVNAVSLFVEKGALTFDAIHVDAAQRIARSAHNAGVQRLVHVSGIGVDEQSPSKFVRARARGEQVVREAFPEAIIVRPSVMFGRNDAFVSSLAQVSRAPVVPLFGQGDAQLQPAFVNDVAQACALLVTGEEHAGDVFEFGGAKVYTYREAVEAVLRYTRRHRPLLPVPFPVWHGMISAMKILPNPPLTEDQLTLIASDNVVGNNAKTFADLGIAPQSLESRLDECLAH